MSSAREIIAGCGCISYNRPQPYQTVQSVVLSAPEWAPKSTVSVDACIAHVIETLWAEKIWTLGCCCGHNGEFMRDVIVDRADRHRAEDVVRRLGDPIIVRAWELVPSEDASGHIITTRAAIDAEIAEARREAFEEAESAAEMWGAQNPGPDHLSSAIRIASAIRALKAKGGET